MPTLSADQIAAAALSGGFLLNSERVTAVAIALAESGGNSLAQHKNMNGSVDYGLWQINSVHASLLRSGSWSNPTDNARMAYQVYADAGKSFRPWTTYTSGRYLAFLSVARRAVYNGKVGTAPPNSGTSVPGSANPSAGVSAVPTLSTSNPLTGIIDLARILTSGNTYVRAAMLIAGALLLWWGIRSAMTIDNTIGDAAKKVGLAAVTKGAI